MVNRADIRGEHSSMLVNFVTMRVNKIIIKVTAHRRRWSVEMWTDWASIIELWKRVIFVL